MKTISLQNKSRKGTIILIIIAVLVFAFFIFNNSARQIVSRPFISLGKSLFNIRNSIGQNELENQNVELQAKILSLSPLEKENEDLKSLLSRIKNPASYILGSIISRPPQSPYDILIIDAGSEQGVKSGAKVTAYSEILLGYVAEVYPASSKVKLISFPGEQTNINILNAGISATATGRGGENLEIQIPDSLDANTGDFVLTQGTYPLSLGTIERIEVNTNEAFKKLFFRLPINLNELKYVVIEK
ncbi:MAG: rod shape-determining protein MreC [Parcubacteria group bacterium Athens0714_24]|nr:MAG: rod shape-determining protein MreC [Parcubacteria group bacterium Athens0714_24]